MTADLVPTWARDIGPGQRRPTEQECIDAAGAVLAASDAAIARMTPREQAEAAHTPGGPSVEDLEGRILKRRGLAAEATA